LLVLHPMEDHKKVLSIQILIEVEVKVLKPHFEADTEARMVHIINMKSHGSGRGNFRGRGSHEGRGGSHRG
jgi:hypothetical protein